MQSPSALLTDLISALNSKNKAEITKYVESRATNSLPIEQRVERLINFMNQGAPFRLSGDISDNGKTLTAIIVDKNETRLKVKLNYEGVNNSKMVSLMVEPEESNQLDPKAISWSNLNELAKALCTETKKPAVAIGILKNSKKEFGIYGVRKLGQSEQARIEDVWSIGSIGKPICSTLIGILIDEGKLSFHKTLKEVFPQYEMNPMFEEITIEQILQHRSGLPQDESFTALRVNQIVGTLTDAKKIREKYVKDILGRSPIGKPGEKFAYSNAGYAILGHIAELVGGSNYEDLVQKKIFDKLGIKNAFMSSTNLPSERPSGHVPGPNGLRPYDMKGPLEKMMAPAGGGLFMSVSDLLIFGNEHLNLMNGNKGILKAETAKRIHLGIQEEGGEMKYACGWGIVKIPGIQEFHGHNGSNGTMQSELAIFPAANLVVVCFTNAGGEEPMPVGLKAVIAVASRFAPGD